MNSLDPAILDEFASVVDSQCLDLFPVVETSLQTANFGLGSPRHCRFFVILQSLRLFLT